MNKQQKQLLGAIVILAAGIGALLGIRAYNSRAEQQAAGEAARVTVMDIDVNSVTGISYSMEGEPVELVKADGVWQDETNNAQKLDEDKVKNMLLGGVCQLTATVEITEGEPASFGLDTPENTIVIRTADAQYTLYVGDTNSMTGERYVQDQDGRIFLVADSTVGSFESTGPQQLLQDE